MALAEVDFIALRLTRHSDRQSILTAYSRQTGRLSIAVPASTGRSASRIRALVMPLSLLRGVVDLRPGREIVNVKGLQPAWPLATIHSRPAKQMTAMFLAEVLAAVLRDNQGDEATWNFIEGSIKALDALDDPCATANFHLWFLYRLGAVMGVEPDVSTYTAGSLLDMRDGLWRPSSPLHPDFLPADESHVAWLLSRMRLDTLHHFRFTRAERNRALDTILAYLSLHLVPLRHIRSLDVLRMMM